MKSSIFQKVIMTLNIVGAIFFILPIIEIIDIKKDTNLFYGSWLIFFLMLINTYIIRYGVKITHIHKNEKVHEFIRASSKDSKPTNRDNIFFKVLRIFSITASILFIFISIATFDNLRNPEHIVICAIFILIFCLIVLIFGRDGTGFLSLYFKRKKLEQIAKIKELEEKNKL